VVAGLNWAEQRGNLAGVAHGSMGIGLACDMLGLQTVAEHYHRRALRAANRVSDPHTAAAAEFGLALHQMYLGEWPHALDAMQRASDAWEHIGRLREWGVACATLAWLLEQCGQFSRSQAATALLLHTAEEAGDVQTRVFALNLDALARRRRGLLQEASAGIEKSCEVSRSIPDYQIMLESYASLARCRLWMGEVQAARSAIEEGDTVARANRVVPHLEASLRAGEAEVMLALLERAQRRDTSAARDWDADTRVPCRSVCARRQGWTGLAGAV